MTEKMAMRGRKRFVLKVLLESPAFQEKPAVEVARILRDAAARLEMRPARNCEMEIRDANGDAAGVMRLAGLGMR